MALEDFGVDKETLEKTKDIYPTLELGKLKEESIISVKVVSADPKIVEHGQTVKGVTTKVQTPTLLVKVIEICTPDKTRPGEMIRLPYNNEKYTLWLSSKSLAMGFARIYESNKQSLEGVEAKITIGTANYADYGEKRCYRVSETNLEDEDSI